MKIQVITKKNYRTDVLVDNKLVYESFLHGRAEIENLKKLVAALGIDVEVTDRRDI